VHLLFRNPTNGRRYQAILGRDLFGDWVLWRGWCGADGKGGGELHQVLDDTSVVAAIERLCRRREARGYVLVGAPLHLMWRPGFGPWPAAADEVAQADPPDRRAVDAFVEVHGGDARRELA
jgi:hypothetical protein